MKSDAFSYFFRWVVHHGSGFLSTSSAHSSAFSIFFAPDAREGFGIDHFVCDVCRHCCKLIQGVWW